MNPRIKAGIIGGIFGALLVIITGGQVAYFAGIVAGIIAGMLASHSEHQENVIDGFRQGVQAGLLAGVFVALAQLIRGFLLNPRVAADLPTLSQPGTVFSAALAGLFLAGLIAAIFTAVRAQPSPRDNYYTLGLFGVLLVAYPWIDQALRLQFMTQIIPICIFILMALGLNIVVGYAGLLDLGYAAFFAIGAYTTGIIASPHMGISVSFWLAIWVAAAVAAIFGLILGAPTLPLRGDYLAIVTLGFGEIVPIAMNNLDRVTINILGQPVLQDFNLTGGPRGINPINRPELFGYQFRPDQTIPWYFLILAIMIFSIFFIIRLRDSRLGRAWMAMREDELAAAAMGIDIVKTKLLAFSMGATFSGFAGAFFGAYVSAIFPSSFAFDVSVMLLCMVILGGLGNITGVILGGIIIQSADRIFLPQLAKLVQDLTRGDGPAQAGATINIASDFRLMLFGLTLVVMMLVRPEGLVPSERRKAELHADEEPAGGTQELPKVVA